MIADHRCLGSLRREPQPAICHSGAPAVLCGTLPSGEHRLGACRRALRGAPCDRAAGAGAPQRLPGSLWRHLLPRPDRVPRRPGGRATRALWHRRELDWPARSTGSGVGRGAYPAGETPDPGRQRLPGLRPEGGMGVTCTSLCPGEVALPVRTGGNPSLLGGDPRTARAPQRG